MKIVIFNGSPHAEHGNTHLITEAFTEGARGAGAEVENIFLKKKKILPCTGCFACWLKNPGRCVQNDDMKELLEKIVSSDILGFAMPLYVDNVSGTMKNFMDRLIPLADPHIEKDEAGECRHVKRYDKPTKIIAISNCGFPEQSHFQVLRLLFRRIARNLHAEVIAEIYRGSGALLQNSQLSLRPLIENYKKLLRKAGEEVVRNSALSEETKVQLEKPLFSSEKYIDDYIARANEFFDKNILKQKK